MQCEYCGKPIGKAPSPRKNGKRLCRACWASASEYLSHWFVKSMEFTPVKVTKHRGLKPLPGQIALLSDDQLREAGSDQE